ncbi:MOSC domain-containing protein [Acidimicrobiia bacterium EGI L10123]|uniref:MOSC domain-containing protein n=1 Tax=Salinilacustrithrix flava TaxID=2957203 RepID=UPI003D7C2AA7|nr:MOSC domain-containing protein [Acidimicrobiia bacterium EGI L10123]
MTVVGTVASIHRFPMKSMQGEQLAEVEIGPDGMVGDREWALRDIETGKLVSAKRPRPWRAALDCTATGLDDDVEITTPSGDVFHVHDGGLPFALEALFGRSVALERSERRQQGTYDSEWPELDGITLSGEIELPTNLSDEGRGFVDLGVLHLLTTSSMATLAAAGDDLVVDVRRFRPSIVLDTPGFTGFPENDDWADRTLRIGGGDDAVEVAIGIPTPRCIMTTVAQQEDLPRQPAVLQAIARINRRTDELGSFACLGAYATVARPGVVRAGDEVTLV